MDATEDVRELAGDILADAAEPDGSGLDRAVWKLLSSSGLTDITSSGDGGWAEAAALLTQVGASAARVPVAEHDLLAGWLLRAAGLSPANGIATAGLMIDGVATNVPWAREADQLVLIGKETEDSVRVWSTSPQDCEVTPHSNLADEPRDTVRLERPTESGVVGFDVLEEFRLRLMVCRALQTAGAAYTVLELTKAYAAERVQFGRPIAQFQSVQELVATIAAEATLISVAADDAVTRVRQHSWSDPATIVGVLVAASCAGHATSIIVRNSHQVLGAMGYTMEHPLHRFTNRMLSWSADVGPLKEIDARLLAEACAGSAGDLWGLLIDSGA